MQHQLDYVLRTVEERGVRFVRLWFTDVLGFLKSFEITPAELEIALEEGMTFDGSAIEGYSRVQESDMLLAPDANTFEIVPWHSEDAPTARMFCDVDRITNEPFEGDPRFVLKRNLERAREKGFTFYAGPEMEFPAQPGNAEPPPTIVWPVVPETLSGPEMLVPQIVTDESPVAFTGPCRLAPLAMNVPPFTDTGPFTCVPGAMHRVRPAPTFVGPFTGVVTHPPARAGRSAAAFGVPRPVTGSQPTPAL